VHGEVAASRYGSFAATAPYGGKQEPSGGAAALPCAPAGAVRRTGTPALPISTATSPKS
jgi:hypothetical protein